jgi:hypothetical protein
LSSFKIHRFLITYMKVVRGVVKCIRVQKPKGKKRPKRNSWNTKKKDEEPGRADIYVRARVNATHYSWAIDYKICDDDPMNTVLNWIQIAFKTNPKNRFCLLNSIKFIFICFVFFKSIAFVGLRRGCGNQWIYYYYAINTLYIPCPGPVHSVYRSIFRSVISYYIIWRQFRRTAARWRLARKTNQTTQSLPKFAIKRGGGQTLFF